MRNQPEFKTEMPIPRMYLTDISPRKHSRLDEFVHTDQTTSELHEADSFLNS